MLLRRDGCRTPHRGELPRVCHPSSARNTEEKLPVSKEKRPKIKGIPPNSHLLENYHTKATFHPTVYRIFSSRTCTRWTRPQFAREPSTGGEKSSTLRRKVYPPAGVTKRRIRETKSLDSISAAKSKTSYRKDGNQA